MSLINISGYEVLGLQDRVVPGGSFGVCKAGKSSLSK